MLAVGRTLRGIVKGESVPDVFLSLLIRSKRRRVIPRRGGS
jgi:hypothetical protein